MSRYQIDLVDEQAAAPVEPDRLRAAIQRVLEEEGIAQAVISLALVDDPAIHRLNRRFLSHDEPTDVLSFALERDADRLEGEIIVSGETAAANARRFGWLAEDELLLYVIHGTLHLVGYDDLDPAELAKMRAKERYYLASFGLRPRYDE